MNPTISAEEFLVSLRQNDVWAEDCHAAMRARETITETRTPAEFQERRQAMSKHTTETGRRHVLYSPPNRNHGGGAMSGSDYFRLTHNSPFLSILHWVIRHLVRGEKVW